VAGIPELSPEAKVGKILTLIGFILDVVGVVAGILFFIFFFVFGTFFVLPTSPTYPSSFPFAFPLGFLGIIFLIAGTVGIIGAVFGILAYQSAARGDFHTAGIYGIVSGLLPPSLLMLIGGILCLVSKESEQQKKR